MLQERWRLAAHGADASGGHAATVEMPQVTRAEAGRRVQQMGLGPSPLTLELAVSVGSGFASVDTWPGVVGAGRPGARICAPAVGSVRRTVLFSKHRSKRNGFCVDSAAGRVARKGGIQEQVSSADGGQDALWITYMVKSFGICAGDLEGTKCRQLGQYSRDEVPHPGRISNRFVVLQIATNKYSYFSKGKIICRFFGGMG